MASELAIQSNQSSMLLRSLVDAGSSDLSYSMPTSYPLMSKEIRELSSKNLNTTDNALHSSEVIWDLNKYQFLRDLMIRTEFTKADTAGVATKFYGLTMFSEITIRSNNRIIQTMTDSSLRAHVDTLPEPQKLAILRRAFSLVPSTETLNGTGATTGCTYTPIFSSFFEDVKNHINLNFLEQMQIVGRFNTLAGSGFSSTLTGVSAKLYAWSYLPDLTYSNFLTAKNHKEGSILNMLCYNTQKQSFTATAATNTSIEAKLMTNYPVFNIHYALVSDSVTTATLPILTADLKFGGMSVFGALPISIMNYEQEKYASKLEISTVSAVARNTYSGTSYTGFLTIPLGLESASNRKFNSGAVSFNNVNTPTLNLTYTNPTVDHHLEVVFEYWQMVSISDLGLINITASY